MEEITGASVVLKAGEPDEGELSLINAQALRPLRLEEIFTFKMEACDNSIDRDFERFTDRALEQMAKLFVGKPVLRDHDWMAGSQTARVYAASVETDGSRKRLILRCYMPRTPGTEETIAAIESGVIRECSVGLRVQKSVCSICGAVQQEAMCRHYPGKEYDGQLCHLDLDDVTDVYEVSLVAVPAQPAAGVVKANRYGLLDPPVRGPKEPPQNDAKMLQRARAHLELEKIRYGGM